MLLLYYLFAGKMNADAVLKGLRALPESAAGTLMAHFLFETRKYIRLVS